MDYPSTEMDIPALAQHYLPEGVERVQAISAQQIHFVNHSMGGILVRYFLQENHLSVNSKVMMLCPPNQGSELSDKFGGSWWYQ